MFNLTKGKKMSITKKHFKAVAEIIDSHNFNYLNEPEDIFPAFKHAYEREDSKPTLIIEYGEYYGTK